MLEAYPDRLTELKNMNAQALKVLCKEYKLKIQTSDSKNDQIMTILMHESRIEQMVPEEQTGSQRKRMN